MAVATYLNAPKVKTPPASPLTGGGRKNQYTAAQAQPTQQPRTMDMPQTNTMATAVQPQARTTNYPPGPTNPMPGVPQRAPTNTGNTPSWQLPNWTPNSATPLPGLNPKGSDINTGGARAQQGGAGNNFWNAANPWGLDEDNQSQINYMNSLLPVAQFDQNNYQYAMDFNEAQRRWDQEFGATQGQNQFQQQLSTRQQQSAEEQARIAAQQWGQQFGHTQQMDLAGLDLSRTQIGNEFTMGMDRNQADRDVASTYADSNRYQANQQLAGTRYASDQDRIAAMYGADAGVRQANLYSDAQRYQAQLGLQEAQGYANAQRYGAQLGLQGQQYQADRGFQEAGLYSGAQRYGSDQQLAGQRYLADQGLQEAMQYANAQRYNTEAQERINAAMMANNLQTAAMQTYGRSQAPTANWARNWG